MKNIITLIALIAVLTSCNSRNSDEFSIKGQIKGNFDGMVYLQQNKESKWIKLDSSQVENGRFEFSGKIEMPDIYFIGLNETSFVSFFNEPSDIKISFHVDSTHKPVVEGSATDADYRKYQGLMEQYQSSMVNLYSQYNEANRNNDSLKAAQLELQLNELDQKHRNDLMTFVKANNESFVSPYLTMRHAYEFDLEHLKEIAGSLSPKLKSSPNFTLINERIGILENVSIGKTAPEFTMNNQDGNPISLSDFRGKVLLVDFWASWCGPCRRENPNVVAAYNEFKEKGFHILGVSLDRDKDSWVKAISDDKLSWSHVSDLQYWNNAVSKQYGVMSIPSNVLIDQNGVIIARNLTGKKLHNKLQEIFAQVN